MDSRLSPYRRGLRVVAGLEAAGALAPGAIDDVRRAAERRDQATGAATGMATLVDGGHEGREDRETGSQGDADLGHPQARGKAVPRGRPLGPRRRADYFAVLALFPALIVMVALLGLLGEYPRTSNALLEIVGMISPGSAVDTPSSSPARSRARSAT